MVQFIITIFFVICSGERPVDLAKSEDSKHVLQSAMDDHLNCKPEVKVG